MQAGENLTLDMTQAASDQRDVCRNKEHELTTVYVALPESCGIASGVEQDCVGYNTDCWRSVRLSLRVQESELTGVL